MTTINIPVDEFYENYSRIKNDTDVEEWEHTTNRQVVILVFESDEYIIVRNK